MKIERVVVIGAGTMGAGIAQWFASQMINVDLIDVQADQVNKALKNIHLQWDKLVEKEKLTACQVSQMKSLLTANTLTALSPEQDLVVEAIIENKELKQKLFFDLDQKISAKTIFASNTSSFPISQLAEAVSKNRQKQFIGLHFFNPAPIMKLVEIIPGQETSPLLARDLYHWFENREKKPALSADTPAFIVNRIARNFYGESLRIAEIDAPLRFREIDTILKEVGGFKMGPFELMDLIGIDVNYAVTVSVWEAYNRSARFAPHPLQKKCLDEGRLGIKNKKGFYQYD